MATQSPLFTVPPGNEVITVKVINPVNFGPARIHRFMGPAVPGLETHFTSPSVSFLLENPSGRKLQELLDEWDWTEHFAPQTETLRYCNFVADIQFDTRTRSAHWQDTTKSWLLTDESGKQYTSRFLITAMGILNSFTLPKF
ncbi:hypothetical protein AJ80_04146 [Polytolypa hystricis UAMH7299]|uniref:Uncharacterized protein n=1 Tax=Polytolypa hystricis (strain UAMH7299) TaxID=1447883 RepID=A0A2B7YEY9_POLH7|nr:hypothetical protein AJ80_04146 [Polytolypa hystricis UAMH7299]